ncbi:MAG: hypothetical protein NTW94_07445 [Legionellales bacterium]|nr:hypothetical protein [Legionellales bacterium]
MLHTIKHITAAALCLFASSLLAVAPKQLLTHNLTDFESNAFIDQTIPSNHPTKAHSDGKVFWTFVKMACFGHTTDGKCTALIMMKTDTSDPIPLGTVTLELETGDITPKELSGNGFTLTVNGPGETTITAP